jgi:NADPH2:quinone reductase
MRAWQIQRHAEPADAIARVEMDAPEPGPAELRIQVEAAALGLPDVFMCRGTYAFDPQLPFVPGQEVVGVVTAAGQGSATPVGARVMGVTAFFKGHGGLADEALALDASVYPAPATMAATEAAGFVIPYHTAQLALKTRGGLRGGETLLVLGAAGGSGSAAVALGKALGARVIAVAGGPEKRAVCEGLGADLVIDHRAGDWAEAVRDATGVHGADLIFDPVGGDAFESALDCIASEGRLLAVGYASGVWRDAPTRLLVGKNASVVGVFVGAYGKPFLEQVHAELLDHWRAGRIRSLASRVVEFDQVVDALGEIADRRATGKLVVRVGASPLVEDG